MFLKIDKGSMMFAELFTNYRRWQDRLSERVLPRHSAPMLQGGPLQRNPLPHRGHGREPDYFYDHRLNELHEL